MSQSVDSSARSRLGVGGFDIHGTAEEIATKIANLGVSNCELVTPGNITLENAIEINQVFVEKGITISAVGCLSKPNIGEDPLLALELLESSILISSLIGCLRTITYFGGHDSRDLAQAIYRYAFFVKPIVKRAQDLGVMVLIENHFSHSPGEVTNTAQGCLDLIHAVDVENFALNFDPCNFAIGGQDLKASYKVLKPYIRNLHIKDARAFDQVLDKDYTGRVVTDNIYGQFIFTAVDTGITDNSSILKMAKEDKLDVPVTVEVHVPQPIVIDTMQAGLRFCRNEGIN